MTTTPDHTPTPDATPDVAPIAPQAPQDAPSAPASFAVALHRLHRARGAQDAAQRAHDAAVDSARARLDLGPYPPSALRTGEFVEAEPGTWAHSNTLRPVRLGGGVADRADAFCPYTAHGAFQNGAGVQVEPDGPFVQGRIPGVDTYREELPAPIADALEWHGRANAVNRNPTVKAFAEASEAVALATWEALQDVLRAPATSPADVLRKVDLLLAEQMAPGGYADAEHTDIAAVRAIRADLARLWGVDTPPPRDPVGAAYALPGAPRADAVEPSGPVAGQSPQPGAPLSYGAAIAEYRAARAADTAASEAWDRAQDRYAVEVEPCPDSGAEAQAEWRKRANAWAGVAFSWLAEEARMARGELALSALLDAPSPDASALAEKLAVWVGEWGDALDRVPAAQVAKLARDAARLVGNPAPQWVGPIARHIREGEADLAGHAERERAVLADHAARNTPQDAPDALAGAEAA